MVRAGQEARSPETGERLLLSGGYEQIRADTAWLGEQGVTEVFYDLNWDPRIGSPDVEHAAAVARAAEILAALAPVPYKANGPVRRRAPRRPAAPLPPPRSGS